MEMILTKPYIYLQSVIVDIYDDKFDENTITELSESIEQDSDPNLTMINVYDKILITIHSLIQDNKLSPKEAITLAEKYFKGLQVNKYLSYVCVYDFLYIYYNGIKLKELSHKEQAKVFTDIFNNVSKEKDISSRRTAYTVLLR